MYLYKWTLFERSFILVIYFCYLIVNIGNEGIILIRPKFPLPPGLQNILINVNTFTTELQLFIIDFIFNLYLI